MTLPLSTSSTSTRSTFSTSTMPTTATLKASLTTPPEVVKAFEASYHRLAKELLDEVEAEWKMPKEGVDRMRQMLEHNVCGGKMNRGLAVVDSLRLMAQAQGHTLTEDETFRAHVVGWALEWLQASFLVADDVMDQSHTRRGKPCWFRVPGVGLNAVNDALLLEAHLYRFVRRHLRSMPYYADLVDLLHDMAYRTECGQLIDMMTAPENDVDLSRFSMERHRYIVIHKTAYYSFYASVAAAQLLAGKWVPDPTKAAAQAEAILLLIGEYFQAQDDVLDAFADPDVLGKVGTDIQDNKCSWLINRALALASPEQRQVLEHNYGQHSPEAEGRVKQVYRDLHLDRDFEQYEERIVKQIQERIDQVDPALGVPKEVFLSFLNKIYKRSK